ncbi:hypothetical protein GMLC_40060 [Geomonas limicola]|uniref:Periplasmic chaperone PpiD n=1 Tax=Geomonas limicola TaxID=2740186 RepID=A0A6V8NF66_9BACT|nr:hypothetical protein GMLC_40060 [Geomonas limicola]
MHLRVPFYSPLFTDVPLAAVNDEKITLEDLQKALMSVHEKMTEEKATTAKKNFLDALQRLINVKLIVMEAKSMELDKLPEVASDLENFSAAQLRQALFLERVKDLKPDEKEVEKLYRTKIKEWKLKTLRFEKEAEAKKFRKEIGEGKDFMVLREKLLADYKADTLGRNENEYVNSDGLGPELTAALENVKAGTVSPVITGINGFIVVKVEDVRSIEKPEEKAKAQAVLLSQLRLKSLRAYKDELLKKYGKENTKLIKSLDLEAPKPGIKKLMTDKRVLVSIKGEKPITVADLTDAIQTKFFHGVENAIKEKKLNREKLATLDEMTSLRLFNKEIRERHIENNEEYKKKMEEYKNTVLFSIFVEKVIKPDVTYTMKDLKEYYDAHAADYKSAEVLQLDGIAFKTSEPAQAALDKLRHGMDFKWLKDNAEDQVRKDAPGMLKFDGEMLPITSFPQDMQKVLSGAVKGDYKLYQSPEGYHYVLSVANYIPAKVQPLEEVKNAIGEQVVWRNQKKTVEEWFKKLRDAYTVKIYLEER